MKGKRVNSIFRKCITCFFLIVLVFSGCQKEPTIPAFTSKIIFTNDSIQAGYRNGTVTTQVNHFPSDFMSCGHCWSINPNPEISGSKTSITAKPADEKIVSQLTDLTPGTTYQVSCYILTQYDTIYGGPVTLTTPPLKIPSLTTRKVESITTTGGISGGEISSDGGSDITRRGVCWSTSSTPTTSNSKSIDGSGTGIFISNLTGLTANTLYYIRAYATNSAGTAYGNELTFTTFTLPTISTTAATSITQTTATSGGNVTADGGATVTARGVCWSTLSTPTVSNSHTTDGSGTGIFTSNLTDLTANTLYYIRAYATNSEGTAYGNELTFTTLTLPTVTTTAATSIAQTTATSGGNVTSDGGASVSARGVCWSTSTDPTTALTTKTSDGTGTGNFISSITGLTPGTSYHVRAYAINSAGTSYGGEVTFSTPEGSGTFTDSRDSTVYKWATIGSQIWMAENLAYLPALNTPDRGSGHSPYYYVYGFYRDDVGWAKTTGTYKDYGVLYNWPAAMNGALSSTSVPSGVQGICPSGWHLPSDAEWTILTDFLTNNGYGYEGSGSDIGKSMAATSRWTSSTIAGTVGNDQASNNSSGFAARPGSYIGYVDISLGGGAFFWSASWGGFSAWCRSLYYNSNEISRWISNNSSDGFSVRCLQN